MPIPALAANIAWEFTFSFIYPAPGVQRVINHAWLGLDAVIVYQAFRFGRTQAENIWRGRAYYLSLAATLITGFFIVILFAREFHDYQGVYLAFGQNLTMSILFIAMLMRRSTAERSGVEGQSLYIAIFKMAGTALSSALFFMRMPQSQLLNFLYVAIFAFDLAYCLLLHARLKTLGERIWSRI
jgi:hypothetical protein